MLNAINALARNRHPGRTFVERFNINTWRNEIILEHQDRINRLLHAGGAQRMPCHGFCGADMGHVLIHLPKDAADCVQLCNIPGGVEVPCVLI